MSKIEVHAHGLDKFREALDKVQEKMDELKAAIWDAEAIQMEIQVKINQPSADEADGGDN